MLEQLPPETRIVVGETGEIFRDAAPEAEIVLTGGGYRALLSELWPSLRNVRWVHSLAAGLEGLLFPELVESPVILTNSRGVFARSLSEFSIAGMLYFAKDLRRMKASQQAGKWDQFDVEELHGRTLGIVGYGEIARATARLAKAFGMRIQAYRRGGQPDPLLDRVFPAGQLDQLLQESDYLLVAAPLTPETEHMLDAARLAQLPAHAVVINVGRGPVIVESALLDALDSGRIRGAVLDVFDQEPLPPGHPFYSRANVLLSPHCADHTATWLEEAMQLFLDNFSNYAEGKPLANIVDKKQGY